MKKVTSYVLLGFIVLIGLTGCNADGSLNLDEPNQVNQTQEQYQNVLVPNVED